MDIIAMGKPQENLIRFPPQSASCLLSRLFVSLPENSGHEKDGDHEGDRVKFE